MNKLQTRIEIFPDLPNSDPEIAISKEPTHSSHRAIIHENNVVVGHKGYRQVKANHGVIHGRWFYEVEIIQMGPNDNARIGWSMISGHLQGPCGFDKFSYSYRAHPGSLFHDSRPVDCDVAFDAGFGQGDFIGIEIYIPPPTSTRDVQILTERKWRPGTPYMPSKTDLPLPKMSTGHGSYIKYYRNGLLVGGTPAFTDLYLGKYYPSLSLFQNARTQVHFGPAFKFPPSHLLADWSQDLAAPPDFDAARLDWIFSYNNADNVPNDLVRRKQAFLLMHVTGSFCLPCSMISTCS